MVRLLTFTNLYPSATRPRHGIFVEQRVRRLVETGRVHASVVVPVLGGTRETPEQVVRHGIDVRYVHVPAIRGLTTFLNPVLMASAARRAVAAARAQHGDFDVIDAHFLYPDGVAAVLLGRSLRKPVVLSARGSDVNAAAHERVAGACIRWAAPRAAALIAVSAALRDAMVAAGLPADRIAVLRNGVDLETFAPGDRASAGAALAGAATGPVLLAVGNLVPEKGFDLALRTLAELADARLVVVGRGPEELRLRRLALELGVADRVEWRAPVPQEQLARVYAGADLTVLTSLREGMPNVLLESLACGTPVVATDVGGCREVVAAPEAGRLVAGRDVGAFVQACREVLAAPPAPFAVRAYAERFGWQEPIARQIALLEAVVRGESPSAACAAAVAH